MPELAFRVTGATAVRFAASPQIALAIEVRTETPGDRIESILLRAAVRILAGRRTHDEHERARLGELFGGDSVWARTSKSLLWAQVTAVVPRFVGEAKFELLLPCSYDLSVAASKYLHGIRTGNIPITVQFSGTLFHTTESGVQIGQIPWDREAPFPLPLDLFRCAINEHFPDAAVLSLRRDVFERLDRYRKQHGLLKWEETLERLLRPETGGTT